MTLLKAPTLGAIALITGAIFAGLPAAASVILPEGCRMGSCSEIQFLSKEPIRSALSGTLYTIRTMYREWPYQVSRPNFRPSERQVPFRNPSISYVFCSKQRPAYIFQSSSDGQYYANLLSPDGRSGFGYNRSSYFLYWTTCHNIVGPNFFSEEMVVRAIRLGYTANLPEDQIQLTYPTDIIP